MRFNEIRSFVRHLQCELSSLLELVRRDRRSVEVLLALWHDTEGLLNVQVAKLGQNASLVLLRGSVWRRE